MEANRPLSAAERFSEKSAYKAIKNLPEISPVYFNPDNLELLRIGMNAVFAADGVIIRIHSPALSHSFVQKQIDFSSFLVSQKVLTPAPLLKEPFLKESYLFSFWERIENEQTLNPVKLGETIREFHLKVMSFSREDLNFFDYFKKMKFRLEGLKQSKLVQRSDIEMFKKFLAKEKDTWDGARNKLSNQVIHSDITPSNVIENNRGIYLFDFDWISEGPLEADFFKLSRSRFGEGNDLREGFFQGYGIDPGQYPRISVLENLQLFSATALLAVQEKTNERAREFEKRMEYWRSGQNEDSPFWNDL